MARKIVINTLGTMGDLHPLIAVAQSLQIRGFNPVFAASNDHMGKIRKAGFEAHCVSLGLLELAAKLGFSEEDFMTKLMTSQVEMMKKFMLGPLSENTRTLESVMEGAAAVIGTPFTYSGHIMAEKYRVPFILSAMQPGVLITRYDPMVTPDLPVFISPAKNPLSRAWNRAWIDFALLAGQLLFGKQINAVRAEHGLPRKTKMPAIDPADTPLILGLYSDVLGGLQPDYYPQTHITGFPIFDSQSGASETLDPNLEAFLDAGSPPLVFSVGSVAFHAAREFYKDSLTLARLMKRRAVLLTGKALDIKPDPDIFVADYVPHSLLFPRAAAIIHHGGMGSVGQALMAGKPQLIVPFNGDQFDNARRVKRLGISATLKAKKYNAARAKKLLSGLLGDAEVQIAVRKIAERVSSENGAEKAADLIADFFEI